MTGPAAGVIVAAGRGTRFGAPDKVLLPLAGRPVIAHVLDAFAAAALAEVIVVVGEHTAGRVEALVRDRTGGPPVRMVRGGARRQDSVAAGVRAVSAGVTVVAIHDGARPLVTAGLIDRCVAAVPTRGGAIAAAPVTDTLKRVEASGRIVETVPRADLWGAQTPQAFDRAALCEAFDSPRFADREFTDEAALFEALGWPVVVVPNAAANPKLTHPGDIALLEAIMATAVAGETT